MRTSRVLALVAACFIATSPLAAAGHAEMESGGAVRKLGRGCVNIVTGWVEIPKRVTETSQNQGTAAGLTWGLARGLGYGFVRTIAGFYELLTFPFPAPSDYESIIQPEYVFEQ